MSSIPLKRTASAKIQVDRYQNSDMIFLLISVDCILVEACVIFSFCIVQKLMPDFALTQGSRGKNEGSSKMYQVAYNSPQRLP